MTLSFRFIQAFNGDAIFITRQQNGIFTNILIDGGPEYTFKKHPKKPSSGPLKDILERLLSAGQTLNLVILSHVDDDHIGGLIAGFEEVGYLSENTKEIWFNSGKVLAEYFKLEPNPESEILINQQNKLETTTEQGVQLEDLIESAGINKKLFIQAGDEYIFEGFKFTLLSPSLRALEALSKRWDKEIAQNEIKKNETARATDYGTMFKELLENDHFEEDKSVTNGSSIAVLLEVDNVKALFLADAFPSIICASLRALGYNESNRLKVDFVKISHHGSKKNTSDELLSIIDTNRFIILTDGSSHGFPNKVTLARIHKRFPDAIIKFNYPELIRRIFSPDELKEITLKFDELDEEIEF